MRKEKLFLSVIVLFSIFFIACPQRTTISEIKAYPGKYRDKEIAIVGRVTNSFGVLGTGFYEIEDGTGRILVATSRGGAPAKGSEIAVSGKVFNAFTFAGQNYGTVLQENERKVRR